MSLLKGLATSVLSFILFLTLSIFSIAFMLHGTVLNSDFVSNQVDSIPVSDIARDVSEELIIPELPQDAEFLQDITINIIEKQEPWIKAQFQAIIDTGYDFLMDETDTLKIVVPLAELKQNLQDTLWDETKDYLKEQLAGKSEAEKSAYLQDIIRQIPEGSLPHELAILPTDLRNLAIEQYLREFTGQRTIIDLPPEITGPIQDSAKEYFDQFLADFIAEVPDTFTIDEDSLGQKTMDGLSTAKKVVGYFQTYYYWLIVLMIVLAALIFVVNMDVRTAARSLGISLTILGVLDLAGIIIAKSIPIAQIIRDNIQDI